MGNLRRVGVFHFGKANPPDPIRSLTDELNKENRHNLEDCLIVLPEGFNIPGSYYSGAKPVSNIRKGLIDLSEKYKVVWVAGLIEETLAPGYNKGFNSAYLIDGKEDINILLCYKQKEGRDEPYSGHKDGCINPTNYRGLGIAVLICNDFMDRPSISPEVLLARPAWSNSKIKIICVPARSSYVGSLTSAARRWKEFINREEHICILAANGHEDDSFVMGNGCKDVLCGEHDLLGKNKLLYSELLC